MSAWVKLRKTRYEQMSSDLRPTTDIPERGRQGRPSFQIQHSAIVRFAPKPDVPITTQMTHMYDPAVRCKRFRRAGVQRSCINVSGL